MGVGGAFLMVPAMIYLIGMPTKLVPGTSLFVTIFVTGFVVVSHAFTYNTIDLVLVLILITGSIAGVHTGQKVGQKLQDRKIKKLEGKGKSLDPKQKAKIAKLQAKNTGRKKVPGRPIMYRTTQKFLEYFGLKDLSDLPTLEDLKEELEGEDSPLQAQIEFANAESGLLKSESCEENEDISSS